MERMTTTEATAQVALVPSAPTQSASREAALVADAKTLPDLVDVFRQIGGAAGHSHDELFCLTMALVVEVGGATRHRWDSESAIQRIKELKDAKRDPFSVLPEIFRIRERVRDFVKNPR